MTGEQDPTEHLLKVIRKGRAERAVIEAAKAFLAAWSRGGWTSIPDAARRLRVTLAELSKGE